MASGSDFAVQATCNDASTCKRYAVQKGYWSDPFITHMVKTAGSKRAPEISRGYYARTESVWQLVKKFVSATNRNCQVVSLGAGLDTTYWRLQEENLSPARYVEIDFSTITTKKSQTIQSKPILLNALKDNDNLVKFEDSSVISNRYSLLPCDLRDLDTLKSQFNCANIDFSLSTLFLSECVLVYMPSEKSNSIIRWVADAFSNCMFVNYEQVNMNDRFGQVMIENLSNRECELPGVDMCVGVDTQRNRFLDNGWQKVECITMWSAYSFLPQSDVQRIEKLEFLDERELLEQLLSHYCISWATKLAESPAKCLTDKGAGGAVQDVPYTVSLHREGQKKVTGSLGDLPESADVVVIGGGSLGCSTAYHLAKMNAGKIVLLEKSIITSGTTWHTAGILWNLRYHSSLIHMQRHTRELLSRILPDETGFDAGWIETGAMFVTKSQTHLDALEQISLIGRDYGIDSRMVTPSEMSSLHPLMNTDGLVGGVYSPQDGSLDPATLCTAYIKAATKYGAKIFENCEVENIVTDQDDLGFKRVVGVETNRGTIKTNVVMNCSGAWAPYIAKMVDLNVPHATYKHAYVVTQGIPGIEKVPHMRDVEAGVYHKRQGDALLFGGYEHDPELVEVEKDFSFGLYDLDWERFEPHMNAAIALVPDIAKVGIRSTVCGPETFTPDGNPLVGESSAVRGFFFGSGFNSTGMMTGGGAGEQLAHWVVHGAPEIDMKFCDINRFSTSSTRKKSWLIETCHEHFLSRYRVPHPRKQPLASRNIRTTPLSEIHLGNGAYMINSHDWEVPAFYHPGKQFPLLEYDYYGIYGHKQHEQYAYKEMMERQCRFDRQDEETSRQICKEVLGCVDTVGLLDTSHLSKFTLSSSVAARLLFTSDVTNLKENCCAETLMLTKQGKILTNVMVWKQKDENYLVQAPSNMQEFVKRHIVQCLQDYKIKCQFTDVTDKVAMLSLHGPQSHQLLHDVITDKNNLDGLKDMETMVTEICERRVSVSRISSTGYSIHCGMDDIVQVYDGLTSSEIKPVKAGLHAMESLQAEAGQHQMLGTYLNYVNPCEANLMNLCEVESERSYVGKEALMKIMKEPLKQQLLCFKADSDIPILPGNAVWGNGSYVGKITTACYGYNMKKYIAYGYVKTPADGKSPKDSDNNYEIGRSSKRITSEIYMP